MHGPKASRLWYAESLNNFKKICNQDKESEVSPYSSSKILSFPCDSLPNSDLKDFITKSSNPVWIYKKVNWFCFRWKLFLIRFQEKQKANASGISVQLQHTISIIDVRHPRRSKVIEIGPSEMVRSNFVIKNSFHLVFKVK